MLAQLIIWTLLGLFVLGTVLYAVGLFNTAVRLSRMVEKTFGNLDSILKQRHDEIPQLVDACRAYMGHEKGLLERITGLRSRYEGASGPDEKIRIENQLNRELDKFQVTVEAYPELKSNEHFLRIFSRISDLETAINDRREIYNEAATSYNTFISQFPALILARSLRFEEKLLLVTSREEKEALLAPFSVA
jgi:LemA protein